MSDLAPMREQVYTDPRPKEYFDRFHERARTREPNWVYEVTRMLTSLYAYTFLRVRSISSEKVPGRGAVILAPNHFSFMDHFLMGCYIRRKVRFMAKSQLFSFPMQLHLQPGWRVPGAPRRARRGDVHHRRDDPRPRRRDHDVLRGRALAHRQDGRPRPSAASVVWRWRRARRSCRSRFTAPRASATGSACAFPRSRFSTATPCAGSGSRTRRASSSRPSQTRFSREIRALYAGLEEHGRKGALERARAARRAERGSAGRTAVA